MDSQILKTLRSLPPAHSLRRQAELVLSDPNSVVEDLGPILRAFNTHSLLSGNRHIVAAWLVQNANWTDEQRTMLTEALIGIFDKALRNQMAHRIALRRVRRGALYLATFFAAWMLGELLSLSIWIMTFDGAVALLAPWLWWDWTDSRRLRRLEIIIESLGHLAKPASIGSVASACLYDSTVETAGLALLKIAGNIRPEHYGSLPANAVPELCKAMPRLNTKYKLAILKALGCVGDARAIEAVTWVANTSDNLEVRQSAGKLLPVLLQRKIESEAASQLLRASTGTDQDTHKLLRAASDSASTNPDLLLRTTGEKHD